MKTPLLLVDRIKNVQVVLEPDGTAVNEINLNTLQIFPNPAGYNVSLESKKTIESVRIFDLVGKIRYQAQVEAKKHEINVSGLVNGIYFIQVKTNGSTITKRLQVVR